MKKCLIVLLFVSTHTMAQKLKPISSYMASSKVSKEAKKFYKKLPAYQKDETSYYNDPAIETVTGSIADSLYTTNNNTRPFYIYLVNRNSMMADGAILEILAEAQFNFLLSSPAIFFQYMIDNPGEKTEYIGKWQNNVAMWLMQPGSCSQEYNGNPELCEKEYRDKVMLKLEGASTAVKDLATQFFDKAKE